ncbi:MAG: BatA domain-containing protein [Pirellulales bacterium]
MATFLFENLLWIGLPMVALPILIHLINMMRHKKVEWAAMEFLLASVKKNRSWIMVKQLLLLLMRMAAIAAVAFMLAQPSLRNRLGKIFGGGSTHQVILLDDSYSMSDKWNDTTAFQQAKEKIRRVLTESLRQSGSQDVTIYRFSQMTGQGRALQADVKNEPLNQDFLDRRLPEVLQTLETSHMATGPLEPLEKLLKSIEDSSDETYILTMVSDYRAKDWQKPAELEKRIADYNAINVIPKFVQSVDVERPNVAVTELRALPGPRAANINITMSVAVTNYGKSKVQNLQLKIIEDQSKSRVEAIETIDPGKTVTRRFEVLFNKAGEHSIQATIAEGLAVDALGVDNTRYAIVDCESAYRVLVIEGNEKQLDSNDVDSSYVKKVFASKLSGYSTDVKTRTFLRNNKTLGDYHAIYLMNVERFDESERVALENYAASGGGVAFFVGNLVDPAYYTQSLYKEDKNTPSLFPCPLENQVALLPIKSDATPDIDVTPHQIFLHSAGESKNRATQDSLAFFQAIYLQRYLAAKKTWKPADKGAEVVAKLRNGFPLAIVHPYGAGRIVTFLTSASPEMENNDPSTAWNNWGRANPSFPITMIQTANYLSTWKQTDESRTVGQPLVWRVSKETPISTDVELVTPFEGVRNTIKTKLVDDKDDWKLEYDDTTISGFYHVDAKSQDGQTIAHWFPYNVSTGESSSAAASPDRDDPSRMLKSEGNTALISSADLRTELQNVKFDFLGFDQLSNIGSESEQNNISTTILYLLVFLLLGEQLLAYSASYHTPAKEATAR